MSRHNSFISTKYASMLFSGTVMSILTSIFLMSDTIIAGIMLGENAVAAVSIVLPVYSMAQFLALVFTLGVPILYVKNLGAFRKDDADRYFGTGLIISVAVGLLLLITLYLGGDTYLRYYLSEGEIYEQAKGYLYWIKYVVMLIPANYLLIDMVYSDGDEFLSMLADLVAGIGHIVLSFILCQSMGAKGLGLATFISIAVSFLVLFVHFFRKMNTLRPKLSFSVRLLGRIMKYGIVDASAYLFIALFTAGVSYYMIEYFGEESLIVVSVFALLKEAQLLFDGIGEAITPFMSMYLGEETCQGVRNVWKLARRSVWIESIGVTILLFIFAPQVISLLGIEDPTLANEAAWGLRLLALTLVYSCRMFLDSSYFILINKIPLGVMTCLLRDLIPALPLTLLGGVIGGVYGMFVGLMISPLLGYGIMVLYISLKYGRDNYALFLVEKEKSINRKLYEFAVTPDMISEVRDQIGEELRNNNYSDNIVNKTMLLFEELYMMIYERNRGNQVLAECAVDMGENIQLILKDNGKNMDLTNMDNKVSSLRLYILANLISTYTSERIHFITLNYNRNAIVVS